MPSLLDMPNEILDEILRLALGLADGRRTWIRYSHLRGSGRQFDIQPPDAFDSKTPHALLQTSKRLKECTIGQMLRRATVTVRDDDADLELLVADLHRTGLFSRLRDLTFEFSSTRIRINEPTWPNHVYRDYQEMEFLATLHDNAASLFKLPTSLRRLAMYSWGIGASSIPGKTYPPLLQAVRRFQELEELTWGSHLSLFDLELFPARPPFREWTTVADYVEDAKKSREANYFEDEEELPQWIPFTILRDAPAFPALQKLTLNTIIPLFPYQMAEALSAEQLPSLRCLHLYNVKWWYHPSDMDPVEWPIARRCFARMSPLTELTWVANEGEPPTLDNKPKRHIPPTADMLEAIREYHGQSLRYLQIHYAGYECFGDESDGPAYIDLDLIDWAKFTSEMPALETISVFFGDDRPSFTTEQICRGEK